VERDEAPAALAECRKGLLGRFRERIKAPALENEDIGLGEGSAVRDRAWQNCGLRGCGERSGQ
jgi:hypothetical protein